MNTATFSKAAAVATVALGGTLFYTAHCPVAAKTIKAAKISKAPNMASVSQGKALISQYRCNSCHDASLAGKPGFSPSLHQNGVLKQYNQTTFGRMLLTGVTEDGGHVRPPMPVYGRAMMPPGGPPPGGMRPGGPPPGGMRMPPPMTKGQAAAIYAYLHTLK